MASNKFCVDCKFHEQYEEVTTTVTRYPSLMFPRPDEVTRVRETKHVCKYRPSSIDFVTGKKTYEDPVNIDCADARRNGRRWGDDPKDVWYGFCGTDAYEFVRKG